MSDGQQSGGTRRGRIRSAIDTVASLSVIVVAGTVVWVLLFRADQPSLARPTRPSAPEAPLPRGPVSLDGAWTEGDKTARAVVIEYSDFQCPFCSRFSLGTLPALREKYVKTGKVLLAFRHLPLSEIHPLAAKAAEAAECAGQQDRFWPMHDALFTDPTRLEEAALKAAANRLGLDAARFDACLGGEFAGKIRKEVTEAKALAITGTPTFLIGTLRPDGHVDVVRRLSGALPLAQFEVVLEPLLGKVVAAQ
jgi:protein-disulfide isomerase